VRGNLRGNLTIEKGANVVIEGGIDGKVVNRGGRLLVHNRGIAEFVKTEGPPEAQAGGVLKVSLTAIGFNWQSLAKQVAGECAAVVKADAFGLGIDPVASTLAEAGCRTLFVSNLHEARSARAAAPKATIYVLRGLYPGTGSAFAEISARPVINSLIEMAEWDVFVASSHWQGGFAVNVDTGMSRQGLTMQEAAAIAARLAVPTHGITLLMSHFDNLERADQVDRQLAVFQDLRRLYAGIPATIANSAAIFLGAKTHCDLVRPGTALLGVNPTPSLRNPMLPVIELKARIVQVRTMAPGESIADNPGWTAKRQTRLAIVPVGYADGYPRSGGANELTLQALVGGRPCKIVGRSTMDLMVIDVTDLPDQGLARQGEMVTLIGEGLGIDDLAAAARTSSVELLCNLGQRFHRVYHAN